jgi:hypothetical protein
MPRKKRNPNQSELDSLNIESENDLPPVQEEIGVHEESGQTFKERAAQKLSSIMQESAGEEKEVGPSGKYHRRKKARAEETTSEIATLFSSLVVLALSQSSLPRELHPEQGEIDVVTNNLSRILSRHIDLSSKLSGDAIDVIGIVIVTSGWYARVSPELRERKAQRQVDQIGPLESEDTRSQSSRALEATLNEQPYPG